MKRGRLAGGRQPSQARAPRRSLFRKYALVCAALVTAALLASGLLQLWSTYRQLSESQAQLEHGQAATAAATIDQFFAQIEPQLLLVNRTVEAAGDARGDQRRAQYEVLMASSPSITALHYVTAEGREQLAVSRLTATVLQSGADFSQDPAFVAARRTGAPAYGPVEFRGASEPYLTLAAPEADTSGGMLLAEVNLRFLGDVIGRLTTAQAGLAYVVDGHGRLLAHRDSNLVLQQRDFSGLPQVRSALAAAGATGDATAGGRDLQGRQVLSAYERVDPPGWYVFVDRPLTDAYAPIYSSLLRTGELLVAGLALALLASFLLARRLVAPIRALETVAARIGAGDLDQRIALQSGDELEALGDAFNRMTERLHESYATLERRVEQRTRELEDAVQLLEQRSEQLAIADRAKSEFLSRMSHELRTPLNAIIGFAEIMELDPQTPPSQQEWVRHMLQAGRHLLGLINEVLDIARIETGRLSLSLEPVALDATVSEVVDLLRPLAARSDIALSRSGPPAPAGDWVRADRQRLQQVLLNLLTNAIKYNRPGGRVTVEVSSEQRAASNEQRGDGVSLSRLGEGRGEGEARAADQGQATPQDRAGGPPALPGGDAPPLLDSSLLVARPSLLAARCSLLRVTVRDTGPGIPADKLARLFTPFDRLGAEASGIEGNGLGLAIAKRLVEAMGGAIGVDSSGQEGSAFWVDLPAAAAPSTLPAAAVPAIRAPPMPEDSRPAVTLLYIEDNLSNVALMQAVLALQPGVRLLPVQSGAEGLALACEQRPDLILLDLNLPDMHGEAVLERLRWDARTRAIPVAVITADATPAQEEKALAGGADAYLTKPLDVQKFLTLLERLLARGRVTP